MSDPLSVAGSAVGIISMSLTVCQGLIQYYVSWKDYSQHVDRLVKSLQIFLHTLELLNQAIRGFPFEADTVAHVERSISSCQHGVDSLQKKLDKVKSIDLPDRPIYSKILTQGRRLLYPFRESTLTKLQEIISELKDNLTLTMSTLSM